MSHYRQYVPKEKQASLTALDGALAFSFSYHPGMVAELKSRIPSPGRRWQPNEKYWLVDTQYGEVCADLAMQYLGIALTIPMTMQKPQVETRAIRLEYLGQAKDRGNGEEVAFGYIDGGWNVAIPLQALQAWFEIDARPGEAKSLYSVLGVKRGANGDEIKSAYRRLTRQWHPDVCHESDAAQQFQAIGEAYSILSDERMRKRYNAGLTFSATIKPESLTESVSGWRSPLRCGWLLVEGQESLGRFVVEKILGWEDITDDLNRVMVTSWKFGDDNFTTRWV